MTMKLFKNNSTEIIENIDEIKKEKVVVKCRDTATFFVYVRKKLDLPVSR